MTSTLRLSFPTYLDASWVEEQHKRALEERPSRVLVDVSAWIESRLFADARLLGFFAALRERGVQLVVSTGREPFPPYRAVGDDRRWALLRGTVAGLIVARLAEAIVDHERNDRRAEVLEQQHAAALAADGVLVAGDERALAVVDSGEQRPAPHRVLADPRPDIAQLAAELRAQSHQLFRAHMSPAYSSTFSLFAFEGFENTRHHGRTGYDGSSRGALRFIQLRRLQLGRQTAEHLAAATGGKVGEYLRRLHEVLGESVAATTLAEITVADAGVGIPGRYAGGPDVYGGDVMAEAEVLRNALQSRATSKASWSPDAGEGLDKMRGVADQLRGFFVIRTGRLELWRDFLATPGASAEGWYATPRAHLPGTSVSVLFPWVDMSQQRLDLAASSG